MYKTENNEIEQETTPKKKTWPEFVQSDVTDFFQANHLKSLSIEDVNGRIKMYEKGEEKMYRSGIRLRLFRRGYC